VVHAFRRWCRLQPDKTLYTWLGDKGQEQTVWSYRDVEQRADAVARALLGKWGCQPGDRAVLMYIPGLDFIAAYWGCLFAGVVAVPVYPVDLRKFTVSVERFGLIVEACAPKVALTHSEYSGLRRKMAIKTALEAAEWPKGLEFVTTDDLGRCDEQQGQVPEPGALAFLQFTSGSTGDPKGVMLNHENLAHNVQTIAVELETLPEHTGVSWVPQYHDMGLIGVIVQAPVIGCHSVLMSPQTMMRDPLVWLQACATYKAHQTCGMDGMYAYAVKKIPEAVLKSLDLSSLQVYMSGGEPVRADTVESFAAKFAVCGLRSGACYPCLGMAENGNTCILCRVSRGCSCVRDWSGAWTSGSHNFKSRREGS
jgi:acyl-CoA synthetase (AMP-forming)/AMP-acid ligase II